MLKLLFVSRAHGEHAGGMERLSRELGSALALSPGTDVFQITRSKTGRISGLVWMFGQLPKIIVAARQHDVVYLGDPLLSFAGWCIKKLTEAKVAVNVHGLDVSHPLFVYQWYLQLFFRNFDYYFPISQHARTALKPLRVSGQVTVNVPGIIDRLYDPAITRTSLDDVLGTTTDDKIVLLTVGRLVKRKGHAWFVQHVLPKLSSNVHYVIAGGGPEQATIQHAATKAAVTDRVHFLGRVSDGDLKTLYNTVDAFIQPNIPVPGDAEGLGLVLLEAALCERPVFAAKLEGIIDAIHDGNNGTLLPPQDAVAWQQVLTNFTPQPNNLARAYTLEQFSWERAARNIVATLQKTPG